MTDNNNTYSSPVNFRAIFDDSLTGGVTIPIIQRDYAQGRQTPEAARIRERFLKVLYDALVEEKKVSLDFVYGSIEQGRLIPLDGQQRLTTLFLLHYYIARHEGVDDTAMAFLHNFSYETRPSCRDFCSRLLDFTPTFSLDTLSEEITDEAWFLLEWLGDPSVDAMLVMLDDIHRLFNGTAGLWPRLTGDNITFFFLPISNMGLTDDLYIKMNARGKPLTQFEHFKAELELQISKVDKELSKEVVSKFDGIWTDMLWPLRDSGTGRDDDMTVDDEFLRLIHFVSDGICYSMHIDPISDHFAIIAQLFSEQCPQARENICQLADFLDTWAQVKDSAAFFDNFVTAGDVHVPGKIRRPEPNLFAKCCATYGSRAFSLGDRLVLHAFTTYIKHRDNIDTDLFRRRLRIVNNLVANSQDNIRVFAQGQYLFDAFVAHVEAIITGGIIPTDERGARFNFQTLQKDEEVEKLAFTTSHPEMAETLFRLEDHPFLNGYIHAVGLEHLDWTDRFHSLCNCNLRRVNRALLTAGPRPYFVKDNNWRRQLGTANPGFASRIWRDIFSPQKLDENFCSRLRTLLSMRQSFDDNALETIIHDYIDNATSFPIQYYLVKYHSTMLLDCYGKYYWMEGEQYDSYNLIAMMTEISIGGKNYDVFLNTLYEKCIGDHSGMLLYDYAYYGYQHYGCDRLFLGNGYNMTLIGSVYKVFDSNNGLVDEYAIRQDEGHTDLEDRIEVGMSLIHKWTSQ